MHFTARRSRLSFLCGSATRARLGGSMLIRAIPVLLLCASLTAQAQAPQAQPKPAGKVEVLWLGQAAIRLTTPGGKVIVIDPWLTKNPKTPAQYKDLDTLGKVDLLLVMDAKDAAYATRELLKPKFALPIHYGTIPQLAGTPAEYQQALGDAKVKVFAIQPGEKVTF